MKKSGKIKRKHLISKDVLSMGDDYANGIKKATKANNKLIKSIEKLKKVNPKSEVELKQFCLEIASKTTESGLSCLDSAIKYFNWLRSPEPVQKPL